MRGRAEKSLDSGLRRDDGEGAGDFPERDAFLARQAQSGTDRVL
jgi:hypothetical protein